MDIAVIGSGLAGAFAARALAARGLKVTVLDVGETLDARRNAVVARLRELAPEAWPAADRDLVAANATVGGGELPKKMHFGSDYIYAQHRPFAQVVVDSAGRAPLPTFARGGFSNIWGAAVLPPDACDMADWPISHAAMAPYFRKVAEALPLCGDGGSLSQSFPAYRDALGRLDPGGQGAALLDDLDRAQGRLAAAHVLYGPARLAIHTAADDSVLPCNGCGQCFAGCMRGSIFSTVPMLDRMIHRGDIDYRGGVFVRSVKEDGDTVRIEIVDLAGGVRELSCKAVFIAAGSLNTTAMLLRSADYFERPVRLKESQKFVVPALRWRGAATVMEKSAVTLAAAFVEAKVPELSDHWVHMQMIPINEMIVTGSRLPGLRSAWGRRLLGPLLRRAMVAWCGMHSDHSGSLELRLLPAPNDGHVLALALDASTKARHEARLAARRIARTLRHAGVYLQPRMIRFANPGSGTHCGSSFPMRARPSGAFDTDALGRPFGWRRVHAVDAAVLPSIPGTTLGFAVMANATRIAEQAPIE
jgi:ferredoxin